METEKTDQRLVNFTYSTKQTNSHHNKNIRGDGASQKQARLTLSEKDKKN